MLMSLYNKHIIKLKYQKKYGHKNGYYSNDLVPCSLPTTNSDFCGYLSRDISARLPSKFINQKQVCVILNINLPFFFNHFLFTTIITIINMTLHLKSKRNQVIYRSLPIVTPTLMISTIA